MKGILIILVSLLFLLNWNSAFAQRLDKAKGKLEAYRSENWPPKKAHYRHTLGYVLQENSKSTPSFVALLYPVSAETMCQMTLPNSWVSATYAQE